MIIEFLWYTFAGVLGGVLGGMGMGGGTILIPLLGIFYNVNQHTAQAVNLISFIPMAVVALIIHFKNKLIDFKGILYIIIPGLLFCVLGFFVATNIGSDLLRRFFGAFLTLLSIYQFITCIKKDNKK